MMLFVSRCPKHTPLSYYCRVNGCLRKQHSTPTAHQSKPMDSARSHSTSAINKLENSASFGVLTSAKLGNTLDIEKPRYRSRSSSPETHRRLNKKNQEKSTSSHCVDKAVNKARINNSSPCASSSRIELLLEEQKKNQLLATPPSRKIPKKPQRRKKTAQLPDGYWPLKIN